jgi:hypothetical protein
MEELPAFNRALHEVTAAHGMRLGVLPLAKLYEGRGDAHIGDLSQPHRPGRDCLHYCVAPGVLDGLARAILGRVAGTL